MMTNTQALRAILARVGTFTGMPKPNIQLANNPLVDGKPFEPPANEIWAKVTVKNAGSFIAEIGSKPSTRTTGIVYIQLFAPLNTGTDLISQMADKWAEHMQFHKKDDLELREASIIDVSTHGELYYQYNVNILYVVN
ncbi:phage tail terminator-like protein [Acinetobacter sp. YH12025]|uniref:phage tail terminator-like protein n=1 Tax=Acinetobacter sp. YH12025 TaxID=2601042 RepID=UPI0015D3EBC2|nr:phage tail terminator-like protein [Acinetobacter sp. YH12025]